MMRKMLAGAAALAACCWSLSARAEGQAGFALIIGVNQSLDGEARLLRYADDDAARYRDLFQALGVRTFLLATLDENTRRLHPAAASEALPPRTEILREVVRRLADAVAQARTAGQETTLHVIYAGHGSIQGGTGSITLEDRHLTGAELAREVFVPIGARHEHLIVDACSAYLFVAGRGQGGERRPLHGFARGGGDLLARRNLGLLLSTSSARESHEWNAFQAGVFSHEVRSGMFGAADADGDGMVAYAEIAAFIRRANEAIPNERYRPEVFWRPPAQGSMLVDLRRALAHRVEIPGTAHGHHYLEDPRGVRLADFHNGPSQRVRLLRPEEAPHLYLQRADEQRSYLLPGSVAVLDTSRLTPEENPVGARSAAHEAFEALFALPFDVQAVTRIRPSTMGETLAAAPEPHARRRIIGSALLGGATLATAVGGAALLSARAIQAGIGPEATHEEVVQQNQRIGARNRVAAIAFGVAGAAAVAGVTVLLWPESPVELGLASTGDGPTLSVAGTF